MTTTTGRPATTPSDLGGRIPRLLLAILLPIGPAAVAGLRFVLPYDTTDSPAEMTRAVYADPGAQSLVLWFGLVAVLTLVPAIVVIGHLCLPHARRITLFAVPLCVAGYLSLAWMAAGDVLLWAGADLAIDPETVTAVYAHDHPTVGIAAGLFVAGHVLGTILLGIAMGRSRIVGWAPAALVIAAQPLHIVSVIVSNHPLDLVAWGCNAVGFAAVSVVMLRRDL